MSKSKKKKRLENSEGDKINKGTIFGNYGIMIPGEAAKVEGLLVRPNEFFKYDGLSKGTPGFDPYEKGDPKTLVE